MMTIPDTWRGSVRCWALAAVAAVTLSAVAGQRAEASLINPGAMPLGKSASDGMAIEVRHGGGGHGGGFHGGGGFRGGAFHGGGFRGGGFHRGFHGGGAAFHGGGRVFHGGRFHAGPRFHGGGFHFARRHHFHRGFYYAPAYYNPYPRCRIVWTYYGPRRVCGYHRWHHWRYRSLYW